MCQVVVGAAFPESAAASVGGIPPEVEDRIGEHQALLASSASAPADTQHNLGGTVETQVDKLAFASAFAWPLPVAAVAPQVPVQPSHRALLPAFLELPQQFPQP